MFKLTKMSRAEQVNRSAESVAERIALHVATVERVVAAGVLQSRHGVLRFSALTR